MHSESALIYSICANLDKKMPLQLLAIIIMLLISQPLAAFESTADKQTTQATPVSAETIVSDDQGVFVVATSRESQPMFNPLDIIVSYNGIPVMSKAHLTSLLKQHDNKSKQTLQVVRDRKLISIEVAPGPWHVDLHDMTQEAYATLITDADGQPLNKQERKKQMGMLQQYIKGRPYRTPNNQGPEIDQKSKRVSDAKEKKEKPQLEL